MNILKGLLVSLLIPFIFNLSLVRAIGDDERDAAYPVNETWATMILENLPASGVRDYLAQFVMSLWFKNEEENPPDLKWYANIYKNPFGYLTWDRLQEEDKFKEDETPKNHQRNSVLDLKGDCIEGKGTLVSDDDVPIRELLTYGQAYQWTVNPIKERDDMIMTYENQELEEYPKCGETGGGYGLKDYSLSNDKCTIWGGSCGEEGDAKKPSDLYIYTNSRSEGIEAALCPLGGCTAEELEKSPLSQEEKDIYDDKYSAINAQRPDIINIKPDNISGEVEDVMCNPSDCKSRNLVYFGFGFKHELDAKNCLDMPDALQDTELPRTKQGCLNWPTTTPIQKKPQTSPSGSAVNPTTTLAPTSTPPTVPPGPYSDTTFDACEDLLPMQEYLDISRGADGVANTQDDWPPPITLGSLNYSIDTENTNCRLDPARDLYMMCFLRNRVGGWGGISYENFMNDWQTIQNMAIENGINPLLALALAAEESGFGSSGAPYLGGTQIGSSLEAQMDGLKDVLNDTNSFESFMCQYNTGYANCPSQAMFYDQLRFWLQLMSLTMPEECKINFE